MRNESEGLLRRAEMPTRKGAASPGFSISVRSEDEHIR